MIDVAPSPYNEACTLSNGWPTHTLSLVDFPSYSLELKGRVIEISILPLPVRVSYDLCSEDVLLEFILTAIR